MKKLATALVALLLVGCFIAACGPTTSKTPESGAPAAPEVSTGFEYAKIRWYFNQSLVQVPADCWSVVQALNEINVEWIPVNPTGADFEAQLMTLIAAGDTPDIMHSFQSLTVQLVQEDLIIPLNDYLNNKYIPNIIRNVRNFERYLPGMRFPDGKDYAIPAISRTDGLPDTTHWIRTDWLEKVGMDAPTNYNELTDVLVAFAQAGPKALNGDDVGIFPAMANEVWGLGDWYKAFCANGEWYKGDDGLPEIGFASSRIKECLAYIKNLMDNNALNKDLANIKYDVLTEKMQAGLVGYHMGWTGPSHEADMQKIYPDAKWEIIDYLYNDYLGGPYAGLNRNSTIYTGQQYVISKACRDVDAALRLMNWRCEAPNVSAANPYVQGKVTENTIEGAWFYQLGERGIHWELYNGYIVQGTTGAGEISGFAAAFPELATKMDEQNANDRWTWVSSRFDNQFDYRWQGATQREQDAAMVRVNAKTGKDIPDSHPLKAYENTVIITDEVFASFQPFTSLEHEILAGFIYRAILGQGDINTLYDEFINSWNQAGYQEVRKIIAEANGW